MTVPDWALYRAGGRQDGVSYAEAVAAARSGDGFVWLGLHEPDEERLRRAVLPLGPPIRAISQQPGPDLVTRMSQAYFRDVSSHLDRDHARLAGHDETIASMLQANLAQLSVAQNNDMRKITSWAAIVAVPTAIAGIYGMNFRHMPELRWELGYPGVMLLMAGLCLTLYWNFKRRGWL